MSQQHGTPSNSKSSKIFKQIQAARFAIGNYRSWNSTGMEPLQYRRIRKKVIMLYIRSPTT
jgi:hypothetical protein